MKKLKGNMEKPKLVRSKSDEATLETITNRLSELSIDVHQIEITDNRTAVARALSKCRTLKAEVDLFYARLKVERDRLANLKKQ